MFELCDNLIGIYKNQNCTKSATINPKAFEDVTSEQNCDLQKPAENGVLTQDEEMEDSAEDESIISASQE